MKKIRPQLLARGVGVVAISTDDVAESQLLANQLDLAFPLLSDRNGAIADRYGVLMRGQTLAVPAVFVIREDRTIAWSHIGDTPGDRPSNDDVIAAVSSQ